MFQAVVLLSCILLHNAVVAQDVVVEDSFEFLFTPEEDETPVPAYPTTPAPTLPAYPTPTPAPPMYPTPTPAFSTPAPMTPVPDDDESPVAESSDDGYPAGSVYPSGSIPDYPTTDAPGSTATPAPDAPSGEAPTTGTYPNAPAAPGVEPSTPPAPHTHCRRRLRHT